MSTTQVSIRLGVEGKAEVKRAFDEVGKAGQDAFRGVATSMDAAGAAADRETQRLQRLAQAARQAAAADQAQRSFNAVLGISTAPPKSARESAEVFAQTAKAAEDLQRRTDALRAQIDPLGAAQKKLNAEISEANALYKAGAISAKEQAAAHALAQARYDSTARALGGIGSTGKLASHQLANAETATTALSRAWDAVKRAASNAFDAVGRVIDRASGGGSPEEQLVRIEQQLAALSRGGGAPSSVLANLRRQADELRAKITEARRQADIGRIEADARELSLKVGDAVRQVVPGAETIRQLEGLRSSLGRLLEDPLAARHVDNLQGVENAYRRVTQALQSYSGENIRFLDPQERKLRLQQIEIALINATTPAQRAALEAERARIELIGQSVTPEQAALSVQQARQRVFAESARFIRDYVRDQQFAIEQTQAEITFIGKSVEEKDKFIARLKAEQDLRRQGISAASAEGQMILANAGRQAALNAQLDRARELVQGWQSVFDSSMNRVADLLVQGQRDWQSWLDAGRAAIADIHRELLKLAVLNPLKNLLSGTGAPTLSTAGGLLGSLFGSGGMGLGPVASAARLFGSPIYHLGGVTGDVAPMRFVPASVFQGAPRLHDGAFLSPDEVPAILQRGERVLSREETRRYADHPSSGQPVVNVVIQTPNPAAFQASRTQIAADLARAVRMGTRGM